MTNRYQTGCRFNRLIGLITLVITLPIALPSMAQSPPSASGNFLDWLFGNSPQEPPDARENGRAGRGDDYCVVSLPPNQVVPLWSDRPVFLIDGAPRSLVLFAENSDQPIWTYPVNQRQTITYGGPPLRPGQIYTLRAQHKDFPNSIYETRQVELISLERQVEVAWALAGIDGTEGSSVDRALARADYFWAEGLEADAWREVMAVQSQSEVAAEAIATATERLCEPPPAE